MDYGVYIFDFDYTLGDATEGIISSVNYALEEMGFPLARGEEVRKTIGMSLQETFTYLTGNKEGQLRQMFFTLFKRKADQVMTKNTQLYGDTIKVLTYLRNDNKRLGMVTTKFRYRIQEILNKFRINNLIDVIVGGEDVKRPKPDPEALLMAMDLFQCAKADVVYIGDSIIDAKTAEGAGVDFIGVTTGTTAEGEFRQKPHVGIIANLRDLMELHKRRKVL